MHYTHIEESELPEGLVWDTPAPRRRGRFVESFARGAVYRRVTDRQAPGRPTYYVLTSRGKRVAG